MESAWPNLMKVGCGGSCTAREAGTRGEARGRGCLRRGAGTHPEVSKQAPQLARPGSIARVARLVGLERWREDPVACESRGKRCRTACDRSNSGEAAAWVLPPHCCKRLWVILEWQLFLGDAAVLVVGTAKVECACSRRAANGSQGHAQPAQRRTQHRAAGDNAEGRRCEEVARNHAPDVRNPTYSRSAILRDDFDKGE